MLNVGTHMVGLSLLQPNRVCATIQRGRSAASSLVGVPRFAPMAVTAYFAMSAYCRTLTTFGHLTSVVLVLLKDGSVMQKRPTAPLFSPT